MTEELAPTPPTTASLVRSADSAQSFPVLERVGNRFARSLREVFASFGCRDVRVADPQVSIKPFAEWRDVEAVDGAICRFSLVPMKGVAIMLLPTPLVRQLVDGFYGGAGEISDARSPFSTGEMRFIARFGERCSASLATAWSDCVAITPRLDLVASDWAETDFVRQGDAVLTQTFRVSGGILADCDVNLVYPAEALRSISKRAEMVPEVEAETVDVGWRDRLTGAILQTRLPLRTIFARPELPLHQLMTLKPGDIVPIVLPTRVPVTVGGRLFAEATVGEANGRVAIKIEQMVEQQTEGDQL